MNKSLPKVPSAESAASRQATKEITSDPANLPPYGYIHSEWMYDVRTRRVPVGFRIAGKVADEAAYLGWMEDTVNDLAEFLWPRYDRSSGLWVGKAKDTAWALTLADLDLIDNTLRTYLGLRVPSRDMSVQGTHKAFFLAEDVDSPLASYAKYENALAPEVMAKTQELMGKGLADFGPAPLRFKEYFQRPRAYQVAFMLGRTFPYEWGKSAVTPALISGHCIQGIMAGCKGYIAQMHKLELVAGAADSLKQWSVDVGDRRVFAGVHYPSDNISSWYIALKLCDHYVFGELANEARVFLVQAIQKSVVFKAMVAAVKANAHSPYKLPLERLGIEAA